MEIEKIAEENNLTLRLVGRLETTTAPMLEAEVKEVATGVTTLLLDFSKLEYVSSAGLRVILVAHKKMKANGGAMMITNANEAVKRVFAITGFSSILKFE